MTFYTFTPNITATASTLNFDEEAVKNEPMLFNCSLSAAFDMGGPITRAAIANMPSPWGSEENAIVDTRTHMLMPGWCPCIPGWHHDDVARGKNGQPDYDEMPYSSEHLLLTINTEIAPTEFITSTHTLPKIKHGVVYGQWNTILNAQAPTILRASETTWYEFDWQTFHRGVPAVKSGWRWFIRVSRKTGRKPTNELRRQVQVYLPVPEAGW